MDNPQLLHRPATRSHAAAMTRFVADVRRAAPGGHVHGGTSTASASFCLDVVNQAEPRFGASGAASCAIAGTEIRARAHLPGLEVIESDALRSGASPECATEPRRVGVATDHWGLADRFLTPESSWTTAGNG